MATGYPLDRFVRDLREITAETRDPREITSRLRPLVSALAVTPTWLAPQYAEPDTNQGFGIHVLHEEPDHSLMVFVAAWAPHRGVAPHNHGTWAVVAGVRGRERNVVWARADDGSRPGHAKLRKVGEHIVAPGDVVMMLPDSIHSVQNDTNDVTLSLHVYGFNLNLTRRSQFDPEREREEAVALTMSRD
jgi:predicted metal-dependent enzyme (double-stranded beta helix superfamily)